MRRNGVIGLEAVRAGGQRSGDAARIDPKAAYGCVDWYLYEDPADASRPRVGGAAESAADPREVVSGLPAGRPNGER